MIELESSAYPQARHLFRDLEHHLFITALFEGTIQGRLFVDRLEQPRAGLIAYHHALCLAGEGALPEFNQGLRTFFQEELIAPRKAAGWEAFIIHCDPDSWQAALAEICAPYRVIQVQRQYYETRDTHLPAPASLPEGFSLRLITPELMGSDLGGLEAIREEMCSERTSVEDFMANSFGFVLVYQNEVAGFCMSEYNTGPRCEIGIATFEPHQRRGLATCMTQAFIAHAHSQGIHQIGWHCWTRNVPSTGTARKAGLELLRSDAAQLVLLQEQA